MGTIPLIFPQGKTKSPRRARTFHFAAETLEFGLSTALPRNVRLVVLLLPQRGISSGAKSDKSDTICSIKVTANCHSHLILASVRPGYASLVLHSFAPELVATSYTYANTNIRSGWRTGNRSNNENQIRPLCQKVHRERGTSDPFN